MRAIVVADSLNHLHGPPHGEVRLPMHLDASARPVYDLDQDYFLAGRSAAREATNWSM